MTLENPAILGFMFSTFGMMLGISGLLGFGMVGSAAIGYRVLSGWYARLVGVIYLIASVPLWLITMFASLNNPPIIYRDTIEPWLNAPIGPGIDLPWAVVGLLGWAVLMAAASIMGRLLAGD